MTRIPVRVPAVEAASYDVLVRPGALEELPELLRSAAPAERYAIVSDAVVANIVGAPLKERLEGAGLPVELIRFPAGEEHKTRESWASVTDALVGRGIGRDGCLLAVGGGVTGDLAGFVAATFMRGVPVVQVPTTLLAMVDASVGGKTGVDTPAGKNLVGAFHQPRAVVIDPRVLSTLPEEAYRAGLAESVKHGAIADATYLEWIRESAATLLGRNEDALTRLIRRSVEIKAEVVGQDPREGGARQVLNFGHTLGHALETWSAYRLAHGFAVGAGMVCEAALGEEVGITQSGTAQALEGALGALRIPQRPAATVPSARILDVARRDKKARDQRTRYTLLRRAGEVARADDGGWSIPLEDEVVAPVIERLWG